MTYLQRILSVLTESPVSIDFLFEVLNIPDSKMIYVIEALKKGIQQNKIKQIFQENVKNKYYGHLFCLV